MGALCDQLQCALFRHCYHLAYWFVLLLTDNMQSSAGLFSPSDHTRARTEKVTMGLTALLTMSVVLLMVFGLVPKSAKEFTRLGEKHLSEISHLNKQNQVNLY